jgi:hypothetical protein
VTRELGTPGGGRGGRGGFGAGGGGGAGAAPLAGGGAPFGGRGGRGGAPTVAQSGAPTGEPLATSGTAGAAGGDQDQNPVGPTAAENLQAKLGTTAEMLNVTFNPNPEQKRTVQVLPAELAKQGARVKKVASDDLPALIQALKDAGVAVQTP